MQTPYNYALNNPLRYIDPDGMLSEPATTEEKDRDEELAKRQASLNARDAAIEKYGAREYAIMVLMGGGFTTQNKKKESNQQSTTSDNVVTQPENGKVESGESAEGTSEGEVTQGGHYSINQVLDMYGYPTREEYLFPKPTFFERLLNFGIPLDREDLAEKVLKSIGNEWDLIHQNLDAVNLDKLKLYRDDLSHLRFKLMTKIEGLDKRITQLQETNYMFGNAGEIRSLGNLKWDIMDHLIPVNDEIGQATRAIKFKVTQ